MEPTQHHAEPGKKAICHKNTAGIVDDDHDSALVRRCDLQWLDSSALHFRGRDVALISYLPANSCSGHPADSSTCSSSPWSSSDALSIDPRLRNPISIESMHHCPGLGIAQILDRLQLSICRFSFGPADIPPPSQAIMLGFLSCC